MKNYFLIDSGEGQKLEQFGPYQISRPSAQAIWPKTLNKDEWKSADAIFTRAPDNHWIKKPHFPQEWTIEIEGILFKLSPTDFGHLGIFPEQQEMWRWIQEILEKHKREKPKVLNLFAYSGGSTLAAAKAGAEVCHVDSSKGMVTWARENAKINGLEEAPIRWIIEDALKFIKRELNRGNRYEGIILDPPSFGRGSKGEVFKIEEAIFDLLKNCVQLLSHKPLFLLFSCHTPGFTPLMVKNILKICVKDFKGKIVVGEMTLSGSPETIPIPSGTYGRWSYE